MSRKRVEKEYRGKRERGYEILLFTHSSGYLILFSELSIFFVIAFLLLSFKAGVFKPSLI